LNYNVSGEVSYIGGGAIDLCDYQTKTILSERICNASNTGVTTITYTCPFGCSHGACLISANCTDRDGDGFNASQVGCGISYDCNDSNSSIKPGAMEICGNNKDDNCNLIADEGCSGCTPGTNRTCLGSSVGICSPGIQMCNATGYWGSACYNPVDPANETCNNLDDNCNGVVDDIVPVSCGTLTSSLNGIGRCRQGLTSCINGSSICNGEVLPAIKEICTNGIDDDCNNRTDESSCTICSGCMQDDKCYDYGFRMNISGVGKYCNSQGVFSNQKLVNASCEDNYECKSNFCGEGKCINFVTEVREQASVLWRILCWLMNPLDESDRAQCNIDHTTSSA
jgi:hypothetical protein